MSGQEIRTKQSSDSSRNGIGTCKGVCTKKVHARVRARAEASSKVLVLLSRRIDRQRFST